eukprot:Polyplicarium_translucidae@DN3297_c0_g2_i1.p1
MLDLEEVLHVVESDPKRAIYELLSNAETESMVVRLFTRSLRRFPKTALALAPFLAGSESAEPCATSPVTRLPDCIYGNISSFLPIEAVRSLGATCRTLRTGVITSPEVGPQIRSTKEWCPREGKVFGDTTERDLYRSEVVRADRLRGTYSPPMDMVVPTFEPWWSALQWKRRDDEEPTFFHCAIGQCPCVKATSRRRRD